MALLLPRDVEREINKSRWVAQRAEFQAQVVRMLDFDDPTCQEWEPVLKEIDPLLRLGRGRNRAYGDARLVGVRPGFFHMVRMNQTAAWTVAAITGPDGESFCEPSSAWLDELRGMDLQNPQVAADLIAAEQDREERRERAEQDEMDRINEDVLDKWKAGTRTFVSMDRSTPWSQNAAGRRGARK